MGANSGYSQMDTLTGSGKSLLEQILQLSGQNFQGGNLAENPAYKNALSAVQQFLPGGKGFAPIQEEANQNFKQNTVPSILRALGSDSKSSSSLNQALGAAGQNLNTSLASQLAQMQLQAAGQSAGLAQLPFQQGVQGANLGLGTSPFAYMQKSNPFWQDLLLAGVSGGSKAAGAYLGKS